MKKNGFTLIELLITIAIISILGVISVGAIMNSLSGAKSDLDEYQMEIIKSSAKLYFNDNYDTHTFKTFTSANEGYTSYNVCINGNLVDDGYIDPVKNDDGEKVYGVVQVKVYDNSKIEVESETGIGEDGYWLEFDKCAEEE